MTAAFSTLPHTSAAGPKRSRTHRPAPRPVVAERVYRRRRAVVGGVSAIVAALSIVAVADVIGGAGAAGASSEAVVSGGVVVAQPGDTLWSIAGEHRGDVAIARYVDALVQLNGGPAIRAGQAVRLP